MRCDGAASGSSPCTSGSSYEAWLQCTTTSSPGFQRVTPSPTFQTMPDASEPPMWWSSAWERKTDTGLPSAAQTLLKFTPAAMTRTVTSNAAGSGTSISSSWNASLGSPSRSARITQAAIVSGSSPGSVSTRDTCVKSTATGFRPRSSFVGRARMLPAELFARLIAAHVQVRDQDRDQHAAHAESPERVGRRDVPDHPAEVLPEEPGEERQRQEDRRDHRQARRELVHAQAAHAHPDLEHPRERVALSVDLLADAHQVVVDVAEVVVGGVAAEAG